MSAPGAREITWANGTDMFCLAKTGLILDLEDKCNAGFAVIMARLESGVWYLNDVRETIRLGLIGGGMAPDKAMKAVERHVVPPLATNVLVAYHVVQAVIFGVPKDDPVGGDGEDDGAKKKPPEAGSTTMTDASDAPK